MRQILTLTRKELRTYFGSPMALIFVGAFLAVTLFSVFWVETFFARGIADLRPLFRGMPLLLIFLVAALTMRQWSEEQRSGTLEILLTLPVSPIQLVVGKFLAVVALVAIALALTLFLPFSVSILGNLDWGPVVGGYLAALLLAGAYAAIGLFISSRTDNQIVALIATVLVGLIFYLIGLPYITDFVGGSVGEVLRALSTSARFESIRRGVIDLRDLLYYGALTGIFLTLNVLSLRAQGWSEGERTLPRRRALALTSALVALNLLVVNVWVYPLRGLRVDLTQYREYTLSSVTRDLLQELSEPMLIRGYFSERTHPLLEPLVPTLRDFLQEYAVAGGGRVRVEFVDPATDPELEEEANQVYGIRSMPFGVSGRYESSVINAYFNVLIQYGDQTVILGLDELVEQERQPDGGIELRLANLEYNFTSSIKKSVYGFQSLDAVLAALADEVQLTVYITPDTLPDWMADAPETLDTVLRDIATRSEGKFAYHYINPFAPDSPVTPQALYDTYGLQPIAASIFSQEQFYLYMVMEVGDRMALIYPAGEMTEADIRGSIEAGLKRVSPGFLQVVGLWTPPSVPTTDMFGQQQPPFASWQQVREWLSQEYEVRAVDLAAGFVPLDVDVLIVVAPQNLDERGLFAIDQFLMRGGALVLAAGSYGIEPDQLTGWVTAQPLAGGVQPLLEHYGFELDRALVLDTQNEVFVVPAQTAQGFDFRRYPLAVDIRAAGMADDSLLVSNLPAVTLNWASPIFVDAEKNAGREVQAILRSSPNSWLQYDANIAPNYTNYPETGFPMVSAQQPFTLALTAEGVFESYFAERPSPFDAPSGDGVMLEQPPIPGTITVSPESARLFLIGSAEFLNDVIIELAASLVGEGYVNRLRLMQNAVAWATEDPALQTIRARGTAVRILAPLTGQQQSFWEVLNYLAAGIGLVGLGALSTMWLRNERPLDLIPPEGYEAGEEEGDDE